MNNELLGIVLFSIIISYTYYLQKHSIPKIIKNIFTNTIFKITFLLLLFVYTFSKYPHISLFVAIIYIVTLEHIYTEDQEQNILLYKQLKGI